MEYVFGVMWLDDIKYLNIRVMLVSKKKLGSKCKIFR